MEFVKRCCRNCGYLGVTKFASGNDTVKKYTCKNTNTNIFNIESRCCDCYKLSIASHYEEEPLISEIQPIELSKDEIQSIKEIGKILEFIKDNELKDINFKYDQVKGLATINGIKDGYKYNTMISFKRGDKEDDK